MRRRTAIRPGTTRKTWPSPELAAPETDWVLPQFDDPPLTNTDSHMDLSPTVDICPVLTRVRAESDKLRAHFEAQTRSLREEVEALRATVQALAAASPMMTAVIAAPDPVEDWIQRNQPQLRALSEELVAIHPARGLVYHDRDESTFGLWLAQLDEAEASTLLTGYASTFL